MAQHTGQLVMQNGFADIITVFQQKVEDVVLPEKVDVLVSEWMGTCLLVRGARTRGMAMDCAKEVQIPGGVGRLGPEGENTSWQCPCWGS